MIKFLFKLIRIFRDGKITKVEALDLLELLLPEQMYAVIKLLFDNLEKEQVSEEYAQDIVSKLFKDNK